MGKRKEFDDLGL